MPPRTTFTEANRRRKLLAFLRGRITLAKLSLGGESFLRAFWPLLTLLGFAYAALAFGGLGALPAGWAMAVAGGTGVVALGLIYAGAKRFSLPTRDQALERLDENLENRPISSLQDSPAINSKDPFSRA